MGGWREGCWVGVRGAGWAGEAAGGVACDPSALSHCRLLLRAAQCTKPRLGRSGPLLHLAHPACGVGAAAVGEAVVDHCMAGFNSSIFAYGQVRPALPLHPPGSCSCGEQSNQARCPALAACCLPRVDPSGSSPPAGHNKFLICLICVSVILSLRPLCRRGLGRRTRCRARWSGGRTGSSPRRAA